MPGRAERGGLILAGMADDQIGAVRSFHLAGDGGTALLPARVEVMEPDVGDVARETLHRHSAPPGIVAERAGWREALVKEHLVQRRMIQGDCGRPVAR